MTQNSETSGPSRYSSTTTRPHCAACAAAAARSSVTTTPLPAASPSSLTTYGAPNSASAASTSAGVSHSRARAVGTPAAAITSFANALLPSSCAAAADGPKHAMPAARTASATPATSGASGPTTTNCAPSSCASAATAAGIGGVHGVLLGDRGGARVARGADQRRHGGIGGERQAQRVLAGTGTDDEDAHGTRA